VHRDGDHRADHHATHIVKLDVVRVSCGGLAQHRLRSIEVTFFVPFFMLLLA
jgi:hypothetical protein